MKEAFLGGEASAEVEHSAKEALDRQWYARYEEAGNLQAYEYLDGNKDHRDKEKKEFLAGTKENPDLDYPKINGESLVDREKKLLALKKDILEQEPNAVVKQAYRWRINEKIAELRLLRATHDGDMRRFGRYSEFVYGKPDRDIFAFTVDEIRNKCHQAKESGDVKLQEAAESLLGVLPDVVAEKRFADPSPELFARIKAETERELDHLFAGTELKEDGKMLFGPEMAVAFNNALKTLKAEGWKVSLVDNRTAISVNQETKTVQVPTAKEVPFIKLKQLMAHEIGTHAARRLNGERSKLMLLGLGLDRYEGGEEGVATMREQSLVWGLPEGAPGAKKSDERFAGLEAHFAAGLAKGLDGMPRDFRGVYTVMEKFYLMKTLLDEKDPSKPKKTAKMTPLEVSQNDAWNRVVRTFRGTDCKTPGAIFTKDMIYREGNMGVLEALGKNPDELMRLSIGKYSPDNERHLWILSQLGITDKDLEELQK